MTIVNHSDNHPLIDNNFQTQVPAAFMDTAEAGFEDIYSKSAYYDLEVDGERALLHILYVPPESRGIGLGRKVFQKLLDDLDPAVKYIRLKSVALGSGCTLAFWRSLGFSCAYDNANPNDEAYILHRAVNGFNLPPVERLNSGDERHYIFD